MQVEVCQRGGSGVIFSGGWVSNVYTCSSCILLESMLRI